MPNWGWPLLGVAGLIALTVLLALLVYVYLIVKENR